MKRLPGRWRPLSLLLVVWVAAGAYLFLRLDRDWIPHDDGTQAQAAERVLAGELPHVDFDDPYTGGLAFLHALAFRLLGVNLHALRLVFFLFSLLFIPALFAIALRVAPPPAAAALTVLCFAWSLPNYVAGVPSWYNLFFATFGILALIKAEETGRRPWYAAAGVAGGLSILAKQTGIYFAAAAVLALVHGSQAQAEGEGRSPRPGSLGAALIAALLALAGLVVALVAQRPTAMDFFQFALPALLVIGLLVRNEIRLLHAEARTRGSRLSGTLVPFGLGLAAPIAVFLLPYVAASGLDELFRGVFVHPQVRFRVSEAPLPPPSSLLAVAPLAVLLLGSVAAWGKAAERLLAVPYLVIAGTLAFFGSHPIVYTSVWRSLPPVVPVATALGCYVLAPAAHPGISASGRTTLFLLVSAMALTSLVQFPYSLAIYFCYGAPLVILAAAAAVRRLPQPPYRLLGIYLGGLCAFAFVWLHPGATYELGFGFARLQAEPLDLPRGGLRVSAAEAGEYRWVVREIQRRSGEGEYIYAFPDAPEVYFLAGRRNPTRTFSDIFDPDFFSDPAGRSARILAALDARGVRVVVLKRRSEFTKELPQDLVQSLAARYPHRSSSGLFLVRWRDR